MSLNIEKLENGNLRLTADDETREELRDNLESRGFWSAFADLLEPYFTNGSYEPFDAGDANPFVGLSSAPCIAEEMFVSDDGERELIGDFWFFGDYAVICPLQTLADSGIVEFQLARESGQ